MDLQRLFSRRERALGNSIMFESNNLQFASMQTKLQMVGWLDRGVMTVNEYRTIALGLEPVEGGDMRLLRKDTDRIGQNNIREGVQMKKIQLKGDVVPDNVGKLFDWFDLDSITRECQTSLRRCWK